MCGIALYAVLFILLLPTPHPLPMKFCFAYLVQCCIPSVKNSTWYIEMASQKNFLTLLVVLGLCCCQLSLVAELGTSHHGGSSCCKVQALDAWASVVAACGFSRCGLLLLGHIGFSSCGPWASLLLHMWNLPRSGTEPPTPALAGRFLSTVPPGKSKKEKF